MITRASLLHAASHHGIFAASTPSGQSGAVLLASLDINLNDDRDCRTLLALIAHEEVTPVACSRGLYTTEQRFQAELISRGLSKDIARHLGQLSWLSAPDRWYYALLLPAQALTASSLHDDTIRSMREWLGDRTDLTAIRLREACSIALGEISSATTCACHSARAACARWWNHYAGITS